MNWTFANVSGYVLYTYNDIIYNAIILYCMPPHMFQSQELLPDLKYEGVMVHVLKEHLEDAVYSHFSLPLIFPAFKI